MNIGDNTEAPPLVPFQPLLIRIYTWGVVIMVLFNWQCYPGTFVGVLGWAALWPIYLPANIIRILVGLSSGDGASLGMFWAEVCQQAIIGLRAG